MGRFFNNIYKFDEKYCLDKQKKDAINDNRKDDRLEKQLGDFGEQLIITLLGRLGRYRVAYVDHEGADIIATDKSQEPKKYAISVKTRQIGRNESQVVTFDRYNQEKLCKFSCEFDMIPAVAHVIVSKDFSFVDVYIMTLEDYLMLGNAGYDKKMKMGIDKDSFHQYPEMSICKNENGDLTLNNYVFDEENREYFVTNSYMEYLQEKNSQYINHMRLDLNGKLDFFSLGDVLVPDLAYDISEDLELKDGNLGRQLGDFGERLLIYVLGYLKGYRVALVDHVGIDLIAVNPKTGTKYGISVKTDSNGTYSYSKEDIDKIYEFTKSFNLIPVLAYVMFDLKNYSFMDVYLIKVSDFLRNAIKKETKNEYNEAGKKVSSKTVVLANGLNGLSVLFEENSWDEEKYFESIGDWEKTKGFVKSLNFSNSQSNQKYLQNSSEIIEHIRFDFKANKLGWNEDLGK